MLTSLPLSWPMPHSIGELINNGAFVTNFVIIVILLGVDFWTVRIQISTQSITLSLHDIDGKRLICIFSLSSLSSFSSVSSFPSSYLCVYRVTINININIILNFTIIRWRTSAVDYLSDSGGGMRMMKRATRPGGLKRLTQMYVVHMHLQWYRCDARQYVMCV